MTYTDNANVIVCYKISDPVVENHESPVVLILVNPKFICRMYVWVSGNLPDCCENFTGNNCCAGR